jgi:hypothetical protein
VACASLALASERASAVCRCGVIEAVSNPLGTLWARPGRPRRAPWCDAFAALADHRAVVIRALWSVDPERSDDDDRLAGRDPCVCGVHVAGLCRIPGAAGLPSPSAEPTGAVKVSPSGPSGASREAVALTVVGRRS